MNALFLILFDLTIGGEFPPPEDAVNAAVRILIHDPAARPGTDSIEGCGLISGLCKSRMDLIHADLIRKSH
jgi:hypothetical protein